MDARRSRWIAFDAFFYGTTLGKGIRQRFGATGLVLFSAFLCACKMSPTQGRFTYMNDADALAQMGLPGLKLIDDSGRDYTLTTFWRYLGDHHTTARRQRGGLTTITATRWEKWQRRPNDVKTGTSTPTNTDRLPDDTTKNNPITVPDREVEVERDSDIEKEKGKASAIADLPPTRPDVEHLCNLLARLIEANGSKPPTITAGWRTAARLLLDNDRRDPIEADLVIRFSQADQFWRSNILSMPKLRDKYDTLRLQMTAQPRARNGKPTSLDVVRDLEALMTSAGELNP